MGSGCTWQCRKCNYLFHVATGVGFLFPQVYKETLDKAKNGELGPELEIFFKEHKDGAIDASNTVLCCEDCGGNMQVVKDKSKIVCPTCKIPLEIFEELLWD